MKKLEESYEWIKIPDNLPRENLVMIKAKTTRTTIHPEDSEYPVRLFDSKEMYEAARSLAQRPVGINHMSLISGAFTVDANWNNSEQCIEALLFVPTYFMDKIHNGKIKKVSVEYTWRDEEKTKNGTVFKGLVFNRVDLLEDINAGDSNTEIKPLLMEGMRALMEGVIETDTSRDIQQSMITTGINAGIEAEALEFVKHLGEPFAGYTNFTDCVVKNKDKSDPEAYCGYIKHKVEPKKKEGSVIATIPDVELKEKNLSGKKQIPEQPMNTMTTQEPTPMQSIQHTEPQPLNPQDKITSIGAVSDNKGPIIVTEECGIDRGSIKEGEPILNMLNNGTGAKQGIESAEANKTVEPKKEEVSKIETPKEELKKEEVKKPEEPKKEEPKSIQPSVEKPKEESKVEQSKTVEVPKIDAKDVKIAELEESIHKLQENAKNTEVDKAKAVKAAKLEVIKKIEKVLPDSSIVTNFNRGGQVLANDVKKVIYDTKKECGK